MLLWYKRIFHAICLLFFIWTGAASSAPLSQADKEKIAEHILNSELQSVAEQLKGQKPGQNFLFCPYGYRQLFHGVQAKYQATGYDPLLRFLQMNPELLEDYMEYISKEKVQKKDVYNGNFLLDDDLLTSDVKEFLKKLKYDIYDGLDKTNKFKRAGKKINEEVKKSTKGKFKNVVDVNSNIVSKVLNVFYFSSEWGFICEESDGEMEFWNIEGTERKKVAFFNNIIIPEPPKTMWYDDASEEDSDSDASEEDSDSDASEEDSDAAEKYSEAVKVIRFAKLGGNKVFYLPFTTNKTKETKEIEQHTMILVLPEKNEKSLKSVAPEEVLSNIELCKQIVQHRKNAGLLSDSDEVKKGNENLDRMNFYLNIPKFFIEAKHNLSRNIANFFKKTPKDDSKLKEVVIQTAFLKVNEDGAEAGAITDAAGSDAINEFGVEINIDRPFAVMIVDQDDTLLFSSIVYNPEYTKSG